MEHLILFHEGLIYDLPQIDVENVTVYDLKRNRVILLDRGTQVRATTTTDELTQLTVQLKERATDATTRDRLGIDAAVRQDDDAKYSITYGPMTYDTVTQQPTQAAIALQYGRFADLAKRLDIAMARGMPPIGRMTLNQKIATDGLMPKKETLTVEQIASRKIFRSTYEVVERISQSDRNAIDEIGNMLALYREVGLREFPQVK